MITFVLLVLEQSDCLYSFCWSRRIACVLLVLKQPDCLCSVCIGAAWLFVFFLFGSSMIACVQIVLKQHDCLCFVGLVVTWLPVFCLFWSSMIACVLLVLLLPAIACVLFVWSSMIAYVLLVSKKCVLLVLEQHDCLYSIGFGTAWYRSLWVEGWLSIERFYLYYTYTAKPETELHGQKKTFEKSTICFAAIEW